MIKDVALRTKFRGGGSFVSLPPVFSESGRYIFVAWKNVVYCYNTKTGRRFLEYSGLDRDVIGFGVYVMEDTELLCACSASGLVYIWKVANGIRLKKTNVPHKKLKSFKVLAKFSSQSRTAVIGVASWKSKKKLHFGFLDLWNLKWQQLNLALDLPEKYLMDIGGPCNNMFLSVVQGKSLYFVRFQSVGKVHKKTITGESRNFTCIACHPENECVLTGDESGRVIVWHDLNKQTHTQAVYHWHTLPVKTVCFSTSGSSFYSGGSECVLVKWNFENSQDRKYLPRLPSAIEQITVADDNLYIAVATADNAVHILDAHLTLVSNVQHLVLGKEFPAGITYDPRSKSLVLNGIAGHLQFYSPHNMNLLYNLDIVKMNKLTGERDVTIENVQVIKVSISRNALWMSTVEELASENPLCYESRLKFWSFNTEKQTFELNTSIESPHIGKTTGLKFQPSMKDLGLRCVTIGEDKRFKIWVLIDATTVYSKGYAWHCAGAAFYRDLMPTTVSFSCDGSLLAISFNNILTTWLPDSCEIKCSLVHPKYKENIIDVAFGTGSQCHLLVSASSKQLGVWNLLTLSMIWVVEINVDHLITDIMLDHMAVFSTDGKLFVFYPHSSTPIYTQKAVEDGIPIISAVFIPNSFISDKKKHWYQKSELFFIDSNKELYSIDNREESDDQNQLLQGERQSSLFSHILPQVKSNAVELLKPVTHSYTDPSGKKQLQELLNTPIQTMIPIRYLVNSILKSMLLRKRQHVSIQETNLVNNDADSSSTQSSLSSKSVYSVLAEDLSDVCKEQTSWVKLVFKDNLH